MLLSNNDSGPGDGENNNVKVFHKLNSVEICHIDCQTHVPPLIVDIKVDNEQSTMEINTGIGVSLILYFLYVKVFEQHLPLDLSSVRCRSFFGRSDCPKKILASLSWMDGQSKQALMGRDSFRIFNWPGLNHVESVMESGNDLDLLISNYKEPFKEEFGCYNHGDIFLLIIPNAVPWFIKPRPILFALQQQVEREHGGLEKTGMINKNGRIRIFVITK